MLGVAPQSATRFLNYQFKTRAEVVQVVPTRKVRQAIRPAGARPLATLGESAKPADQNGHGDKLDMNSLLPCANISSLVAAPFASQLLHDVISASCRTFA